MSGNWTPKNVRPITNPEEPLFHPSSLYCIYQYFHIENEANLYPFWAQTDLEDVGQQLIEDNIVSVSRQMIDKEASMAKATSNGDTTSARNRRDEEGEEEMDVDEEL